MARENGGSGHKRCLSDTSERSACAVEKKVERNSGRTTSNSGMVSQVGFERLFLIATSGYVICLSLHCSTLSHQSRTSG